MAKIRIRLKRSLIGKRKEQIGTIKALGLKKINSEVEKEDTPQIRGMIDKVSHMIEVEEI